MNKKKAVIIGGSGQTGYAIAKALLAMNWHVILACRNKPPFPFDKDTDSIEYYVLDRRNTADFYNLFAKDVDLVVDLIAFTEEDAKQLLSVQERVGMFVVLSSSSVYCDERGQTLDEASINGFPDFPNTIKETNKTVNPGRETYSTNKVALEHALLGASKIPVKILRPAAIYGPYSHHPREWWFVKRMLDKRPSIPLVYEGTSRFHTTAANNIANVVIALSDHPANIILNVADKEALTVEEIGRLIARHLHYKGELVALSGEPIVGHTPWSIPKPFVLDTTAAKNLLKKPLETYKENLIPYCDWLVSIATNENWKELFPQLSAYPYDHFDYKAEDDFFHT